MTILGISAFYHDSAAAILTDGKIVAAAQEERFSRKKHDASFPIQAIKFCLRYAGKTLNEVDAIAFYDKPLLKFERLLETYYAFAPKGVRSFIDAMPVWIKEKIFLKRVLHEELSQIEGYHKKLKLLFPEHHLSHAASAFFSSPFSESAILTIDGVGEWATASIGRGKGNSIEILKELHFPHSVGLLYSAFTYYLGFRVNSGEYKLMGLAPYGQQGSEQVKQFIALLQSELVSIKSDGSIHLNQDYFNYATGREMTQNKKWEKLFGFGRRSEEEPLQQHHCNLAFAIQQTTEDIVLKMAAHAKEITGCNHLCMAGGVALNCVANGKIQQSGLFAHLFVQPASGDAGGALGAAQSAHYIYYGNERQSDEKNDTLQGAYLGDEFSHLAIEQCIRKFNAVAIRCSGEEELASRTAQLINSGNVVGWMQGRMEFGPRALGNRSILADARRPEMQKKLNLKIKYRESFRPFAPSVLAEDAAAYFDLDTTSPYMLLTAPVKATRRNAVPAQYTSLGVSDKLYVHRSDIPAVTHVDFSARVQTVHKETNPLFHLLIEKFKALSGCSLVINTSFNVRGEPPVCTPEDAYRCFMRTEMDYLVLGNYIFAKPEQPEWRETASRQQIFTTD